MSKNLLIFGIIITLFCSCFGNGKLKKSTTQVDDFILMRSKSIPDDVYEHFLKTTTVFFYKNEDLPKLDSIKNAISKIWNITPIIFENISRFNELSNNDKYSFIAVEEAFDKRTAVDSRSYPMTIVNGYYIHDDYLIVRCKMKKSGKSSIYALGRIDLSKNDEILKAQSKNKSIKDFKNKSKFSYSELFYIWNPVYLMVQLGTLQYYISQKKSLGVKEEVMPKNLKIELEKDTLYISRNVIREIRGESNEEGDTNMLKQYHFPYRICSNEELYQIFVVENRGRFIFDYSLVSVYKLLSIYDVKSKNMIFKNVVVSVKPLKGRDFRKIGFE